MHQPRPERVAMPESLRAAAEQFASGERAPVPPRDAATVVLLRNAGGQDDGTPGRSNRPGTEVYLLRRHARMAFAPGMAVFPGGGVDDRDREAWSVAAAWAGPSQSSWARQLGCDVPTARGLVCAAVRETFEESGVLLAGAAPDALVADTTGADWEADREALVAKQVSLAEVLSRRGLVLRSDLMRAWAQWITPDFEPRRYDTRFFVAVLPEGQRTRDVSTESDAVAWMRPGAAVDAVDAGDLAMMPPTVRTCQELAGLERATDVLAAAERRRVVPIEPRLVVDGDRVWLQP